MAGPKLDKGFLILYEWLPALMDLSPKEFKKLLISVILFQGSGEELPKFDSNKASTLATIISATIERRKHGKSGGYKGNELKRMRNTSIGTTLGTSIGTTLGTSVGTTLGTRVPREEKRSIEEYIYSSSVRAPAREEVAAYAAKKKAKIDPSVFFEHFEEREWKMPDGSPVRDWRKMFDIWEENYEPKKEEEKKTLSSFDVDEAFANALKRTYGRGGENDNPCD